MIKIENVVYPSVPQMKMVIMGARNSFCSRDKSDSQKVLRQNDQDILILGKDDLRLLERLSKYGDSEGKYLRMMHLIFDMTAPLYFWKQFDTYKVGTVSNSESTMHSITKKPFDISDFSLTSLTPFEDGYLPAKHIQLIINELEMYRVQYEKTHDRKWWNLIIELLPESYMQKRTIDMNYQVLKTMRDQRSNHKLKDWQEFIKFMENTVPYYYLTEIKRYGDDN